MLQHLPRSAPLLAGAALLTLACQERRTAITYPEAERSAHVDTYHDIEVADPYRWFEDLDSAQTAAWVAAQNELSRPILEAIPARQRIVDRLTEIWDHERYGTPSREGDHYFFSRNDGLQNQSSWYRTASLEGEPELILDPNGFSEDGTVSLAGLTISPDARFLAYATSDGGSDWDTWHVRDLASGEDLAETIAFTKFTSASWSGDSRGFYYSRYPQGADGRGDDQQAVSLYYHRLGTSQSEDQLVFSIPEHPRRNPYGTVSEDGRFLIISIQEGYLTNAVATLRLDRDSEVTPLFDEWDARYDFLGNIGDRLFFQTNLEADRERVVALDLASPTQLLEILPESENTLEEVALVGGRLIATYLQDARNVVEIYRPDGSLEHELELPGVGSVGGFSGKWEHGETFYSFTSFTTPTTIYHYEIDTGSSTVFRRPQISGDLDRLQTEQVFVTSPDGARVPMFVISAIGLERNGDQPTLLYGYGGFSVSLTPSFSLARIVWLEQGGVLAIANLRGGGEYGKEWHMAGTGSRKQNVFDDFIAAAQWLIDNGFTSPEKLAIQGASNGGLLVGAALTQRPELFGATLPAVGVLDMLRYHTASANARNWATDYGLSENEEDFRAQLAYSPLHNVAETCYPPTLVTTADHDDRVVPWHSFKFAAELQHRQQCDHPILVRVETRAGHGAGTPTWMQIENIADQWAFLVDALGME